MQEFKSRSDKRLIKLRCAAGEGCMSLDNELLYGSEIKRYEKQGFEVSHTPSSIKNLDNSKIDWSNAFNGNVPYQVFCYISGITPVYPKVYVKTFAQELYVIAAHVNYNKK